MAINVLMELTNPDRYATAIAQRMPATSEKDADYEVHLFVRERTKAGLINITLLAHAIEEMGTHFLAVESTFDAGTVKGEDVKQSVKIW